MLITWARLLKALVISAIVTGLIIGGLFMGREMSYRALEDYTQGYCLLKMAVTYKKDRALQAWATSCVELGGTPGWFFDFDGSLAGPRCEGKPEEK